MSVSSSLITKVSQRDHLGTQYALYVRLGVNGHSWVTWGKWSNNALLLSNLVRRITSSYVTDPSLGELFQ